MGQPDGDEGSAQGLVLLLCDLELAALLKGAVSECPSADMRELLLALAAVLNGRYAYELVFARGAGAAPAPPGPAPAAAEATAEASAKAVADRLGAVDGGLGAALGVDVPAAVLVLRGVAPARAARWLSRAADALAAFSQNAAGDEEPAAAGGEEPAAAAALEPAMRVITGELGIPAALLAGVRVDRCAVDGLPARCFAFHAPDDLRLVVPHQTRVGSLRTLAHELGHAVYFRAARGSGQSPWAFEPAAGPEAAAFSLEYAAALLASEAAPAQVNMRLARLAREVEWTARAALVEMAVHGVPEATAGWRSANLPEYLQHPWSTLDYALARLTAFAAAIGVLRQPHLRAGQVILECLVRPGARRSWAERHNSLVAELGVGDLDLEAPPADASDVASWRPG